MSKLNAAKLIEARDLIADKQKWTQHQMAKDSLGRAASGASYDAVCFCAAGALERVYCLGGAYSSAPITTHWCYLNEITRELFPDYDTVHELNDYSENAHTNVLAVYDEGIRRLQAVTQESLPI